MATEADEARVAVHERLKALERLTWDELDAYGERTEEVVTPSGHRLEMRSQAYWDMDEWQSGIEIEVKARPADGRKRNWWRRWPYKAYGGRGDYSDQVPERPPGWVSHRRRGADYVPPNPDPLDQLRREFDAYKASRFPVMTSDSDAASDAHARLVEFDTHIAGLVSHVVGRSSHPHDIPIEDDSDLKTALEQLTEDPRPDVAADGWSLLWTYTRLEQLIALAQRVMRS